MAGTYYGKCNSLLWNMCFGWHCVIWVFLFFFGTGLPEHFCSCMTEVCSILKKKKADCRGDIVLLTM